MSVPDMHGDGGRPPGRGTRRFLRSKRTAVTAFSAAALTLGLTLPMAMTAAAAVSPGTVGTGAKFEDNDANLNVDNPGYFDWNSFAPVTWNGTAPYQDASKTATNGTQSWTFKGVTDAQATTSDTGFAGGTKQDDNCPSVTGTRAPNKDDLQSSYFATSVGSNGHIYLMLAWERIKQNTTSPSAHVAFEFNQGSTACGSGSDSLVNRTAGDMLIVYDFTGGSTSTPTIGLSRWITSGTCQVGSDSPPCWGVQATLPPSQAEGAVNTGLGPYPGTVSDSVAQGSYLSPNGPLSLGASQFGEAGVDLTAAGVFGNTCTTFGTAWSVSRSSGNSSTAAMEDLVGPAPFNVSNCATSISTQPQSSTDNSTFSNLANNASISAGTYVRDQATVSVTGVNTWTGNVDFYLCKSTTSTLTSCDPTGANATQIGGDVAVSNSATTATSGSTQVNDAGSYCWAAKFTGTSPTNLPSATSTTGECFTVTAPTSIATNPWFYPQDRATISASSGGDLAGSVSFKLFDNSADCTANSDTVGTGGLLYQESDPVSGASPQTVDTTNSSYRVTSSTANNLYWRVTYASTNSNQTNSSSVCVENIGATITPDGTVSFP